MNLLKSMIIIGLLFINTLDTLSIFHDQVSSRQILSDNWLMISSTLVTEDGSRFQK